MGLWGGDRPELTIEVGRADAKFGAQMFPLVEQLSVVRADAALKVGGWNFGSVEAVTSALGFPGEAAQKRGDGVKWAVVRTKSGELRMMFVAAGAPRKDLLRQQGFAPRRDQSFRIEVARM